MYIFQGLSGYLLLLGLMIGEGLGLPIPSEVIMPLVGYYSYEGSISLYLGVISATLGSLIGSIIAYYLGFLLGYPFLKKYGKYLLIDEKKVEALHIWFIKYGDLAVFGFRFLPELRALISYPAGIAKMSMLRFLTFTFFGHLIWDVALSLLGYHYANEINYVISLVEKFGVYALGITIVLIITYVIIKVIKR